MGPVLGVRNPPSWGWRVEDQRQLPPVLYLQKGERAYLLFRAAGGASQFAGFPSWAMEPLTKLVGWGSAEGLLPEQGLGSASVSSVHGVGNCNPMTPWPAVRNVT